MSEGIVATLRGTDDLHMALRARAEIINIKRRDLDGLQGCAPGYTGKQLSPKPQKRLTLESVFTLANALGCDLALIENPELMRLIASRDYSPRNAGRAKHAAAVHVRFSKRFLRTIGKKGGHLSRSKVTKRYATKLAKRAARARWHGVTKRQVYAKAKKTTPRYIGGKEIQ